MSILNAAPTSASSPLLIRSTTAVISKILLDTNQMLIKPTNRGILVIIALRNALVRGASLIKLSLSSPISCLSGHLI